MGTDPVHATLLAITKRLEELGIPYSVVGALALGAHGYVRATADVDILLTREGHRILRERCDGLGYTPAFPGSRNFRNTHTGVRIKFLIAGDFPGGGKPNPSPSLIQPLPACRLRASATSVWRNSSSSNLLRA